MSDHETYREQYNSFTQWVADAKEKLDQARNVGTDREKLQQKMDELKVFYYHLLILL